MLFLHLLASQKASGQGHLSSLTSDPSYSAVLGTLEMPSDIVWDTHADAHAQTVTHVHRQRETHTHLITLPSIMQYTYRQVLSWTESGNMLPVCLCVWLSRFPLSFSFKQHYRRPHMSESPVVVQPAYVRVGK